MKTKKLLPQEGTMLPNEATLRKPTIPFPVLKAENVVLPEERKPFWLVRFGLWIGTLMVRPNEPKGWGWNPSVITLLLVIAGLLTSGGWYLGVQWAESRQMQKEIDAFTEDARKAKERQTYNAGQLDAQRGHTATFPSPTPTK